MAILRKYRGASDYVIRRLAELPKRARKRKAVKQPDIAAIVQSDPMRLWHIKLK